MWVRFNWLNDINYISPDFLNFALLTVESAPTSSVNTIVACANALMELANKDIENTFGDIYAYVKAYMNSHEINGDATAGESLPVIRVPFQLKCKKTSCKVQGFPLWRFEN